jgi:hypothetical protein
MLRRLWIVLAFLLVPAVASADDHRAIFGGGSGLKASKLGGIHLSFEAAPSETDPALKCLLFIGDFGLHTGTHDGADVTIKTFAGGVGWRIAPGAKHSGQVHGLFGGANSEGNTEFVTILGAAYELLVSDSPKRIAIRGQVDGIIPKEGDKFLRFSGGVVFRF